MNKEYLESLYKRHSEKKDQLVVCQVADFFENTLQLLFPELGCNSTKSKAQFLEQIDGLKTILDGFLKTLKIEDSKKISEKFWAEIQTIHSLLEKDVLAMFAGDPAAKSTEEIVLTYPGFYAISAYRIANILYKLEVPILPRLITENAHSKTGIDIHPGAAIGESFCIDHGTGIVIGETTTIGNGVKIYQGVTLGALSVNKEDADIKRHPTIEDGVVIYAGATILGGRTTIGENSVVGGNVWITKSIEKNSKVYYSTDAKT
ncbi:MAG: serine acetyltransferase [Flavobacteriaceae bacterium]|nr:MAG: serine acetyltransferase [Flavobacteriaceae bacterium]